MGLAPATALTTGAAAGLASEAAGRTPAAAVQVVTAVPYAPAQPAGSRGHLLDLYLPDSGFFDRALAVSAR